MYCNWIARPALSSTHETCAASSKLFKIRVKMRVKTLNISSKAVATPLKLSRNELLIIFSAFSLWAYSKILQFQHEILFACDRLWTWLICEHQKHSQSTVWFLMKISSDYNVGFCQIWEIFDSVLHKSVPGSLSEPTSFTWAQCFGLTE